MASNDPWLSTSFHLVFYQQHPCCNHANVLLVFNNVLPFRVIKVDLSSPGAPSSWPDVVPEHEKDVLSSAIALKGDNLVTA